MRKARVFVHDIEAGVLLEEKENDTYIFTYHPEYQGPPVSLTMPTKNKLYKFNQFPTFFEGLLPEGAMLEALLRSHKLDKKDHFGQLLIIGHDVVGAVTIESIE